jgi:DNA-directed RNA polymerase subunit RPC12/RpoP
MAAGGRSMREFLQLPFTCHNCHHAFSVPKAELDKNRPIHCPKCAAIFRLKSEQMKHLAPGRKPVKD